MKLTQIKPNLRKFGQGLKQVYFSYETPIAFYSNRDDVWLICTNMWTPTTAKHLSQIKQNHPNHVILTYNEFEHALRDYI